jgi:transcriptional regulator with XRE-family HTH domain
MARISGDWSLIAVRIYDRDTMTSARYSPTVRRRRLSAELVRLRQAARMTGTDVAVRAGMTKSTLSNIETGEKLKPRLSEVRAILEACGLEEGAEFEEIMELCRQSHQRGWWRPWRDVLSERFAGFETEASAISTWEPNVLPGLLQVPSYVEVTAEALLAAPGDVRRAVDARMTRQKVIMDDDPPELWAIFDESALLRLEDHPEVRREQIAHLIEIAEHPAVTLQMTNARRLNPGSGGPFVIMDFPTSVDPTVVYLETDTDGLYLEEPDEIARYRRLFNHLRLVAWRPGETIERLQEINELETE